MFGWLRRRAEAAGMQLSTDLEGEDVVLPPEQGSYRGATAPGFPKVKNTGLIALTRRRLVFRTLTGKTIEVPVASITGVREAGVFKGSVVGGQTHLIVVTTTGEIGFFVFSGNGQWLAALTGLAPHQPGS